MDSLLSNNAAIGRQARDRINTPRRLLDNLDSHHYTHTSLEYHSHLFVILVSIALKGGNSTNGCGVVWVWLTCGQRVSAAMARPTIMESPITIKNWHSGKGKGKLPIIHKYRNQNSLISPRLCSVRVPREWIQHNRISKSKPLTHCSQLTRGVEPPHKQQDQRCRGLLKDVQEKLQKAKRAVCLMNVFAELNYADNRQI
jgi:hypothetical protein